MTNNTINLMAAIYRALNGNVRLGDKVLPVYDMRAPAGKTPMPYVIISHSHSVNNDNQSNNGEVTTIIIQTFSSSNKSFEAQKSLAECHRLLNGVAINISGNTNLIDGRCDGGQILSMDDGLTYKGIMRYRATVYNQTTRSP